MKSGALTNIAKHSFVMLQNRQAIFDTLFLQSELDHKAGHVILLLVKMVEHLIFIAIAGSSFSLKFLTTIISIIQNYCSPLFAILQQFHWLLAITEQPRPPESIKFGVPYFLLLNMMVVGIDFKKFSTFSIHHSQQNYIHCIETVFLLHSIVFIFSQLQKIAKLQIYILYKGVANCNQVLKFDEK